MKYKYNMDLMSMKAGSIMFYLMAGIFLSILLLIYAYFKNSVTRINTTARIFVYICVFAFTAAVVVHPEDSYKAASDGLNMWLNIVCPSLLPFFIGSDLMVSLGMVDILGLVLEPVMRPVFNVPGCGSFPFLMSVVSGYPVGSKIVAEIYNKKMCTKTEAQRLLSFCSTSGPLFMIGAVGVGMLNIKGAGFIIALSHYLGAITVGIIFRFYGLKKIRTSYNKRDTIKKGMTNFNNIIKMQKPPIGQLLSNSVKNSVNSLLTIGGFIVLFSVIIKQLYLWGMIDLISSLLYALLSPFGIEKSILGPVTGGIFEITVGSKLIASSGAGLNQRIVSITGIIAWSGISIHAQVASMLSTTDLKMPAYMLSKAMHGVISSVYAWFIISFFGIPSTFRSLEALSYGIEAKLRNPGWIDSLTSGSLRFLYLFLIMSAVILIYYIWILCKKLKKSK